MIELLERQKKLTSNQWKLICTANVADLLDFFDFFLIGYVTAALTKEWSLSYGKGARSCWRPVSARSRARLSGAGWAIASAAVPCSSGRRSRFRWRPASWFSPRAKRRSRAGCSSCSSGSLSASATPASSRSTCRWSRNSSPPISAAGSARWLRHCCRAAACWPAWSRRGCCRWSVGATFSWSGCRRSFSS